MARDWDFPDLGGKLRAWLDPTFGITLDGGGDLVTWEARVGGFTGTAGADITMTTLPSGRAALNFTASFSGVVFDRPSSIIADPGSESVEIFALVRYVSGGSIVALSMSNGVSNEQYELGRSSGSGGRAFCAYGGGNSFSTDVIPTGRACTLGMVGERVGGSTIVNAVLDETVESDDVVSSEETYPGGVVVGERAPGGLPWGGYVADIVWTDSLTQDERDLVLAKMGFLGGHVNTFTTNPYRNGLPQISEGGGGGAKRSRCRSRARASPP